MALDRMASNPTIVLFGRARIRARPQGQGAAPRRWPIVAFLLMKPAEFARLMTLKSMESDGPDKRSSSQAGAPGVMEAGNRGRRRAAGNPSG